MIRVLETLEAQDLFELAKLKKTKIAYNINITFIFYIFFFFFEPGELDFFFFYVKYTLILSSEGYFCRTTNVFTN